MCDTCQGCAKWYELTSYVELPRWNSKLDERHFTSAGICWQKLEKAWWKECARKNTAPRHPFDVMRWACGHADTCLTTETHEACRSYEEVSK